MSNADSLLIPARQAAKHAHCPYSNFRVGATVRCDDGTVINGCNVENASYGLSICAERVALFTAISLGKRPLELAVSCIDAQSDSAPGGSRMPCGACRQVMQELLPSDAHVCIDGVGTIPLEHLFPAPFQLGDSSINQQLQRDNRYDPKDPQAL
ncbi:hypothetical protein KR52_13690 [Synechococcus sp. KORDI-52]|uniref:cytidine deaminase n=1 Tax=Synechococcus sp. KORDI-52 TaxID=585425 RepID=UPI0004E0A5F7|nr:cytidine deaminase [Synechococcus sp. KORDI-52]AII50176.1 hypothetical protein KR52_13690 [Synechococcus sp. KORDI-52]